MGELLVRSSSGEPQLAVICEALNFARYLMLRDRGPDAFVVANWATRAKWAALYLQPLRKALAARGASDDDEHGLQGVGLALQLVTCVEELALPPDRATSL